jgi:hypothetical protein
MYYFCTYFDSNYLTRGLALYQSLKTHCQTFKLWALCMDDDAYTTLIKHNFPDIKPISLGDFESGNKRLLDVKKERSSAEYYFTCTPSLPLYILDHYPDVDLITYLDADLFFFADPAPLFAEIDGKSISIVGHRFPARLSHLEITGLYNVGWVSFRRDEDGLECLRWWRDLCLEWCYDRVEAERFADQKYLDRFPERFGNEIVIRHKGADVAPWNIENYVLTKRNHCLYVDDEPLIFYHFQGLKKIAPWIYNLGFWSYSIRASKELMKYIYIPYIQTLRRLQLGVPSLGTVRGRTVRTDWLAQIEKFMRWWFMFLNGIARRRFAFIVNGKVISL